jgi:transaldolase/glucose-6-phosphate isomerase
MSHPAKLVHGLGQSLWYDNIRRGLLASGELAELICEGGIRGVTSNPAIFEKAIAGSTDYDEAIRSALTAGLDTAIDLYERLAIEDIQGAADLLRGTWDASDGRDGYVSLEVSPYLANDTEGTLAEARRLFAAIARPNAMIKVPATPAGIPAIEALISEGIPVNVTLLFSRAAYEEVTRAWLAGLEARAARGGDLSRVASVASFFISRIDSSVDHRIGLELDSEKDPERRAQLKSLLGQTAIANARLAYDFYRRLVASPRWLALAERGAQPQRLLWASTGTKNPKYAKTLYVDELIGADTVNTLPTETYQAFRSEGTARAVLNEDGDAKAVKARRALSALAQLGIDLDAITAELLAQGVQSFSDAFDKLLAAVEKKREQALGAELGTQREELEELAPKVDAALESWRRGGNVRRLWRGDATLWTGGPESRWLGWLHVPEAMRESVAELEHFASDISGAGIRHAVLLGMGGSSLGPEVLSKSFCARPGFPELIVLDSIAPDQVRAVEAELSPLRSFFLVSSKSGTTAESNALYRHFRSFVERALPTSEAGSRFAAITDPGTPLHALAKREGFSKIFHGVPEIGGRFSVLSNFGMVPAALMGIDVADFLDRALVMSHSCASCVPPEVNPGVRLGAILASAAQAGRDKVTIVASPGLASFGLWLEQLIAESTGKRGKGLVPIAGESVGAPGCYGSDRLFIHARLASDRAPEQDAAIAALAAAGHPVVRCEIDSARDLGQAFFRWEIATAVAGSLLGLDPFDQPDVEAAKVATRELLAAFEASGELPSAPAQAREGSLSLFADAKNAEALRSAVGAPRVPQWLTAQLNRLGAGDYLALQAYLPITREIENELQRIRMALRDAKRVATTLGFGPRFLHSTGQLHKGGPDSGVFLQLTADPAQDLEVAGQRVSLGMQLAAQAAGDLKVLGERGRRALRVHLGRDPLRGLQELRELIELAL